MDISQYQLEYNAYAKIKANTIINKIPRFNNPKDWNEQINLFKSLINTINNPKVTSVIIVAILNDDYKLIKDAFDINLSIARLFVSKLYEDIMSIMIHNNPLDTRQIIALKYIPHLAHLQAT